YRWDYPMLAALIAPRPLLISNTDKDNIFPLDGVVRTHALVRKIYKLYDAGDKLGLQITEGPHKDTQELRIHAFVWLDRYLKGENRFITDPAEKFLEPEQLKVFASLPQDEINTKIDETFVPKAPEPEVPEAASDWESLRNGWMASLEEKSFAGWPTKHSPLDLKEVSNRDESDLVLRRYEFTSQE
ncbi:MAG: acetylxylan esterase, partial [Planctomycetota bacterium]|nr:acetylxylan esterase [Planctomycetota bacterium]